MLLQSKLQSVHYTRQYSAWINRIVYASALEKKKVWNTKRALLWLERDKEAFVCIIVCIIIVGKQIRDIQADKVKRLCMLSGYKPKLQQQLIIVCKTY